jgi:hypothetical protein
LPISEFGLRIVVVSKSQEINRRAVVDELGEVDRQERLWTPSVNPHTARRVELSAIIQGWYANSPADSPDTVEGKQYRLEVKPCQFERVLTPETQAAAFKRFKLLELDPFTVFRATQASIQLHLGEGFLDAHAPKVRTGRRAFTVIAKAAPALQKAA